MEASDLPRGELVCKNRRERAAMKVFIKERRILARCRVLPPYVYSYAGEGEREEVRLALGMSVGLLGRQPAAAAAAENFEQVEQSGIEWSFGDLAE